MPNVTMPEIPWDVVVATLECVFNYTTGTDHFNTMMSCSLVCKEWTRAAQRILFRSVRGQGCRSTFEDLWRRPFIRTITDNPLLGTYVRSISDIHIVSDEFVETYPEYITSESQFVFILASCPNLVELEVNFRQDELSPSLLSRLSEVGQHITSLRSVAYGAGSSAIYQVFDIWPIRSLHIRGGITVRPPSHRPPFTLERLVLEDTSNLCEAVLQWFLPQDHQPSNLSLAMSYPYESFSGAYNNMFSAYAPHIRTLSLVCLGTDTPPLDACEALSRLTLRSGHKAAFVLPPSIQHLCFYPMEDGYKPMHQILAAVTKSLPHLTTVSVNEHVTPYNQSSLKDVCDQRGVGFLVSAEPEWPSTIDLTIK
ncbi:hypothetical protein BV25DRAFT_1321378 [Artomyces pyxidatus]|uniref:Uncharacterized protein n=1 Tax=Artomyces pyxidatus TaxID=48021 RepID=A0ACB8SQC7_9AGAM|nr:hypothetical protein BV25DRAFT_1321378 [Artomyces pyxidatus]